MKPDAIIIPYKLLSKWDCIIIKGVPYEVSEIGEHKIIYFQWRALWLQWLFIQREDWNYEIYMG